MIIRSAMSVLVNNQHTDLEVSFLSTVHKLSGVHAFGCNEQLFAGLELVGVSEVDEG